VSAVRLTYVLPLRCDAGHADHDELASYLATLADLDVEVIVVDSSEEGVAASHRSRLDARVRHVRPDPTRRTANGKVANVLTGIDRASHDHVVIADDDVRHDASTLAELGRRLGDADVVVPANVFDPAPWHARWDTGRTLLNRSWWIDYPGTLALRRSAMIRAGGYDGDVLFENLELLRTVEAYGGRIAPAADVFVTRRPPSARAFLAQRVRQAYDDLAQPTKLIAMLAIAPLVGIALARRAWRPLLTGLVACVALAEVGRRRDGGRRVFPRTAAAWAPAWLAERAVCVWIALAARALLGGVRYRGTRLRTAATPRRELRRRAAAAPQPAGTFADRTGRAGAAA
jgi:hypothetical protein